MFVKGHKTYQPTQYAGTKVLLKGWNLGLFVNFGQFPCQINADQDRDPQHLVLHYFYRRTFIVSKNTQTFTRIGYTVHECVQSSYGLKKTAFTVPGLEYLDCRA